MTWTEIKLGDAIHVKHGFAFKGQFFADSGTHVVLTPGNFNEGGGFPAASWQGSLLQWRRSRRVCLERRRFGCCNDGTRPGSPWKFRIDSRKWEISP